MRTIAMWVAAEAVLLGIMLLIARARSLQVILMTAALLLLFIGVMTAIRGRAGLALMDWRERENKK